MGAPESSLRLVDSAHFQRSSSILAPFLPCPVARLPCSFHPSPGPSGTPSPSPAVTHVYLSSHNWWRDTTPHTNHRTRQRACRLLFSHLHHLTPTNSCPRSTISTNVIQSHYGAFTPHYHQTTSPSPGLPPRDSTLTRPVTALVPSPHFTNPIVQSRIGTPSPPSLPALAQSPSVLVQTIPAIPRIPLHPDSLRMGTGPISTLGDPRTPTAAPRSLPLHPKSPGSHSHSTAYDPRPSS